MPNENIYIYRYKGYFLVITMSDFTKQNLSLSWPLTDRLILLFQISVTYFIL